MTHPVLVVGPRDARASYSGMQTVFTVSRADDWQRGLSPFHLGPVQLYNGSHSRCMENAWQFAKVYASHLDTDGSIRTAYWEWARKGWSAPAVRYPMGKGAKPAFMLWDDRRLGYVESRKQVYWRLYRDAVRSTSAWDRLTALHRAGPIALWDFDGFNHDAVGMSLSEVIEQSRRPMGHAFVLKAMLVYGADVEADQVAALEAAAPTGSVPLAAQLDLFTASPSGRPETPPRARFRAS